jgi:hypothetical protein
MSGPISFPIAPFAQQAEVVAARPLAAVGGHAEGWFISRKAQN